MKWTVRAEFNSGEYWGDYFIEAQVVKQIGETVVEADGIRIDFNDSILQIQSGEIEEENEYD